MDIAPGYYSEQIQKNVREIRFPRRARHAPLKEKFAFPRKRYYTS